MKAAHTVRPNHHRFFCMAVLGVAGLLQVFGSQETPEQAVAKFLSLLKARDAEGIIKVMDPEVVSGKDMGSSDVEAFLKRYHTDKLVPVTSRIDSRFKSDDGKTERFQATMVFRGPVLADKYPAGCTLLMTLQWVSEEGKWWLERPVSANYVLNGNEVFPTAAQQDAALRFEASVAVLDKLGLSGTQDVELAGRLSPGSAVDQYKELEKLYQSERGKGGVDPNGPGVQVLLKAGRKTQAGLLRLYQADLPESGQPVDRPAPWEMFRDYVNAAVKLAKSHEAKNQPLRAEQIYRILVGLGRQFLDEPGGFNYAFWGTTFQKQAAQELARLLTSKGAPDKEKATAFLNLTSRRLDLLQTALNCLDDMVEYRSLQAAMVAARRLNDPIFMPWGINTLAIYALRGAPADPEVIKTAGAMVLVENPAMKKAAESALASLESDPSSRVGAFVARQRQWVTKHQVYGAVQASR